MATTPRSQSALATDPNFVKRLQSLLTTQAIVVAGEPVETPGHDRRRMLAQQIIAQPTFLTQNLAHTIVNGTNLVAAETSYNFEALAIETSASDAEIFSQIASLWDIMAGVVPEVEPIP